MRVFIILLFFLIIILTNLQRTIGNDCRCECCTSTDCRPTLIGTHSLWYCSETSSCTQSHCIDWYQGLCPSRDALGQTRAICISNAELACFYKVFIPNNTRRSIQKTDYSIWNTTRRMTPYRRPATMPQIRLDWLEKFGLIKRTSTSTTTNFFKPRF